MKKLIFLSMVLFVFIFSFDSDAKTPQKKEQTLQTQGEEKAEEEAISIQADGVGTLKDDVTSARKMAINDGLRIAVEQARGIMVKGETEVRDYAEIRDEVISKTKGFVKTYKILKETKEDNVYRVTLEVEVMLLDPTASAPVKMDEQKYKANVPKLLEETMALFRRTNLIADSLRNKKHDDFTPEDVRKLHQRYRIMLQIVKAIGPPPGKKERMLLLVKAIRLKAIATDLFAKFLAGDGTSEILKEGFTLNQRGNQILKEFHRDFPKRIPPEKPFMPKVRQRGQ